MYNRLKSYIPLLFLSITALFFIRALFHPGFFTSHDGWHQVARLHHFTQALFDGQIPPRWSGELLQGTGYPLFIFSYHLPWWLGAIPVIFGMSIFDSIKFVFILTYLLSGLTMYAFLIRVWGKKAALAGSLVYMVTPYRFATILVRANIGEAVGFVFLPLIFLGMLLLKDKKPFHGYLIGAVAIAGAVLSHIMVLFLAFPAIVAFFVLQLVDTKKYWVNYIRRSIFMVSLGLGIASYYLLPAIYYRPLTIFSNLYSGLYKAHFTSINKILYSPWGYSPIGIAGEMSRQLGLMIWGFLVLTIYVLLYRIIRKKFDMFDQIGMFGVGMLLFAIFMMTEQSSIIWNRIEDFTMIDFPWRFLSVTTFAGGILAAFLVFRLKKIPIFITISLLLIGVWYTNRNHIRVNEYTNIPLDLFIKSERTTNTDDEYLPKWVSRVEASKENQQRVISNSRVDNLTQDSSHIYFTYELTEAEQMIIRQNDFPGMTLYIDDVKSVYSRNGDGFIIFAAPKGTHTVNLKYEQTALMRFGNVMSILSLIILGIYLWKAKT